MSEKTKLLLSKVMAGHHIEGAMARLLRQKYDGILHIGLIGETTRYLLQTTSHFLYSVF
jgi:hypothetical protein